MKIFLLNYTNFSENINVVSKLIRTDLIQPVWIFRFRELVLLHEAKLSSEVVLPFLNERVEDFA